MLLTLTGNENVDRLSVVVSGSGDMKLPCIPKVPNGTGESINQSINEYSFNKSCQTQLKTAKILAMYTQYKIAKKIESYKVLCSVTSFV